MIVKQLIAIAPLIIIAGTALAVMLGIAIKRLYGLAYSIAAAGIIIALLALCRQWRDPPVQVTALLRVDGYAQFYLALLLLAGLAVLGFCYDYFKTHAGENEELPLLLLTAQLGAAVLVCSSHFASFFLGLEILSISLFALIGYPLRQDRALAAAIHYLVLSGVSSAVLLLGMALSYAQSGELFFKAIALVMAGPQELNLLLLCGMLLIIAGLGFKLSLLPFHMWTPDVYQGAPAPITGFIATVSKGAVFALLLRYFNTGDHAAYPALQTVFSLLAGLSIIGGNLLALLETKVKRLLAYSSIAHLGYLMVAVVAGGATVEITNEAISFYLTAYIITLLGAFGVVAMLSTPAAEADEQEFYRGLFWRRPGLAFVFTLMLLSLAGMPFTAGFIAKFYIFISAADEALWGLLAVLIVGSGMGLYYYLRLIMVMTEPVAAAAIRADTPYPAAWASTVTLALLTLLLVWFGIYPQVLIEIIQSKWNAHEELIQAMRICLNGF